MLPSHDSPSEDSTTLFHHMIPSHDTVKMIASHLSAMHDSITWFHLMVPHAYPHVEGFRTKIQHQYIALQQTYPCPINRRINLPTFAVAFLICCKMCIIWCPLRVVCRRLIFFWEDLCNISRKVYWCSGGK